MDFKEALKKKRNYLYCRANIKSTMTISQKERINSDLLDFNKSGYSEELFIYN